MRNFIQRRPNNLSTHATPESQLLRPGLSSPLTKEKGHSFEENKLHVLDREDRWFERGVKEAIYVKLEQSSHNRRDGVGHQLQQIMQL